MTYEYKIDGKVCPHLLEFKLLGGFFSEQGMEYYEKNWEDVRMEDKIHVRSVKDRRRMGGDLNIHLPETVVNPPTPFL